MLFKVGQKVVYPNHGIAIIEQIDNRQINGEDNEFYLLRLHTTNSTVMVPVRNALEVGLRHPIANKQCNELLRVLAEDLTMPEMDWKNRFKDFGSPKKYLVEVRGASGHILTGKIMNPETISHVEKTIKDFLDAI